MAYNPNIHHRRSIRLQGYDYAQEGLYFITICCHNKICHFGSIENNEMVLSLYGKIAYNEWLNLSERFSNFELDVFQIMPNHMHGIIVLNTPKAETITGVGGEFIGDDIGVTGALLGTGAGASPAPTIGDIIGAYKSLVSNQILEIFKSNNQTMGKLWQRNYHDHIIRDEQAYQKISNYIIHNPKNWKDDTFYT